MKSADTGFFLFLVPVGTLLTILGFLTGRAAAVSTCDVLLFFGLCLYLTFVLRLVSTSSEIDAVFDYFLEIVHVCTILMVEQTHAGKGHRNAVFVAGLDDIVISHRAAGLGNELHATLMGAFDIVAKGEESITT